MTISQPIPIWSDVAKPTEYAVQTGKINNFVQIATAFAGTQGQCTIQNDSYFLWTALSCWTNYDDVGPVTSTADTDPVLTRPFVPDNFTAKFQRDTANQSTNLTVPQAQMMSSGYRAGKTFPLPIVVAPRTNFLWSFQDKTGLFLLDAVSQGDPVPLNIYLFLRGYNIPIAKWKKFCLIYPQFAAVYAD